MQPFTIGSKTVSIFPSIEPEAPITYLNTFSDEGQKVYGATQPDGCPPFTLVAISDLDWNHDMVPWDSPPVFSFCKIIGANIVRIILRLSGKKRSKEGKTA